MAFNLTTWSASDLALLRELVTNEKQRRRNAPVRTHPAPNTDQSPEVYIAKIPEAGISASVSGVPGVATCTIYQLISGTLYLLSLTEQVYNVSSSAVTAGAALVIRDKFGVWVVSAGSGSSVATPSTGQTYATGYRILPTANVWSKMGPGSVTEFSITLPHAGLYLIIGRTSASISTSNNISTQRHLLSLWNNGASIGSSQIAMPQPEIDITSSGPQPAFETFGSTSIIASFSVDLVVALRVRTLFFDVGSAYDIEDPYLSFMEIISNTGTGGASLITEALTAVAGGTVNDVLTIGSSGLLSSLSPAALGDSMGGITGNYGDD